MKISTPLNTGWRGPPVAGGATAKMPRGTRYSIVTGSKM